MDASSTAPKNKGGRPFAIKAHFHPQIVQLVASGWTHGNVAKFAKVGLRTLERHLARPEVREAVAREREAIQRDAEASMAVELARRDAEAAKREAVARMREHLLETARANRTTAEPQAERVVPPAAPTPRPAPIAKDGGVTLQGAALVSGAGARGAIRWDSQASTGPEIRRSLFDRNREPTWEGYGTPKRRAWRPGAGT